MYGLSENREILSRLSKATREEFLAKLDGKKAVLVNCSFLTLEMLQVADQYNLVKLKVALLSSFSFHKNHFENFRNNS
jgi:hypothetical protein